MQRLKLLNTNTVDTSRCPAARLGATSEKRFVCVLLWFLFCLFVLLPHRICGNWASNFFYKPTVSLSLRMCVGLDGESGLIGDGQAGGRKAHKSDKKVEE